ncbi:subtilisin-like protein [Epithele typhae]|uniref:subtilisin-like protein n=1 Tax=Epithele typhae TaxID=378194 RepID=UPI0020073E85|nr:subtilisin-like protein [Epithele typhae]KAH9940543.1 subtilisin-like protein [Epithele typhae]
MFAAGLLLLGVLSFSALGRPTAHAHDHYDTLHAAPDAMLDLRIALVQGDPKGLETALYDVSTPGGESYGKHLTKAQVEAFVAPKPQSVKAVKKWLAKNNITAAAQSASGDWLTINLSVGQANALLGAQFNEYTHDATNITSLRTMAYSVPSSVKGHLDFVYPTTSFVGPLVSPATVEIVDVTPGPLTNRMTKRKVVTITRTVTTVRAAPTSSAAAAVTPDASCVNVITPKCLQDLYGVPSTPASAGGNNLFVATFIGESADPSDLTQFLGTFRPDVNKRTTFGVQSVDGGTNNRVAATTEASLDMQYTVGIATGVNTTQVSVGTSNSDGIAGFLDVINALIAQEDVPLVLTTSFGFNEKDVPVGLANNLCNAYAQLGARGTTVVFGSGDGGVSGIQNTSCTTFQPTFPSTCPFVTSVGGTKGIAPEAAASFSSGGFSNVFGRPSYQDAAVSQYLSALGKGNQGLFNSSGRAFPDVATQAQRFQVVKGGKIISVSGTSAASPTFASIVALLNDALLKNGGSPLGFLNPFLYQSGASAFNDITRGSNPGCGSNGFTAAAGWDPVTGLGTPNFNRLLSAVTGNK